MTPGAVSAQGASHMAHGGICVFSAIPDEYGSLPGVTSGTPTFGVGYSQDCGSQLTFFATASGLFGVFSVILPPQSLMPVAMTLDTLIRNRLHELAEPRLAEFSRRLMPGVGRCVMGVRVPLLRRLAAELARRDDAAGWLTADPAGLSFEEVVLRGLLIGRLKTDSDTWLARVAAYVPLIDNWAACDIPCSSFTAIRRHAERGWDFLMPYTDSREEYAQRFGLVMLLDHYVNDAWIDRTLARLSATATHDYYAQMAQAWALSVCFVKYPEKALPHLGEGILSPEVRRMTLQKIAESRRLTGPWREIIRQMRTRQR